jgi:16S rRNA (cytosine1402-N4)-methyltransferase
MSRIVSGAGGIRVMPRARQRRPDGRPLGDLCLRPGERPCQARPIVTDDHQPVMVEEVLHFLAPRPDGVYVDATLGAGGHAEAVLRAVGGRCTLIGVDRDPQAIARASYNLRSYKGSVRLVRTNFADLEWIVSSNEFERVDGILLDLGMSSMQLDDSSRGFAFRSDGPLDMRMDLDQKLTAADIVNTYSQSELARIIGRYGDERFAGPLARAIVTARRKSPIRTTTQLADVLSAAYPSRERRQHPARRTFQALRIAVNAELEALTTALLAAPSVLAPGGRIVVISYQSHEDRLVKDAFSGNDATLPGLGRTASTAPLRPLTRGAVLPSTAEVERNARASAAKLRAAVRRADDRSAA